MQLSQSPKTSSFSFRSYVLLRVTAGNIKLGDFGLAKDKLDVKERLHSPSELPKTASLLDMDDSITTGPLSLLKSPMLVPCDSCDAGPRVLVVSLRKYQFSLLQITALEVSGPRIWIYFCVLRFIF